MAKVVLDAGHGGSDPGAVYEGRQEKDDNLALTLAVGEILENNGVDVEYTRTTDVYHTPFEKAQMGNRTDADYFISFHRNALPTPNTGTGVETLVYNDEGIKADMARAINANLAELGFANRGVIERPNLVVLRRTRMPALLVEAGFIDNEADNAKFDSQFNEIARAIADGILETLNTQAAAEAAVQPTADPMTELEMNPVPENEKEENPEGPQYRAGESQMQMRRGPYISQDPLYRVQVGAFENQQLAERWSYRLQLSGYPAFVLYQSPYYKVQVGAYRYLDNAVLMEQRLRMDGYETFLVSQ